jgi:itaconate CoA-transferase
MIQNGVVTNRWKKVNPGKTVFTFAMGDEAFYDFLAFQSSIKDGKISKIIPRLSGPVTTPRTDLHYVVTENGVANLKGLSSTERAHALIGLADPAFQDELTTAAKESHLI